MLTEWAENWPSKMAYFSVKKIEHSQAYNI